MSVGDNHKKDIKKLHKVLLMIKTTSYLEKKHLNMQLSVVRFQTLESLETLVKDWYLKIYGDISVFSEVNYDYSERFNCFGRMC